MKNNDVFGIEGYNMPRKVYPEYRGTKNMIPKEKGKNFAEVQASYTKHVPGPGEYPVKLKWGSGDKKAPTY